MARSTSAQPSPKELRAICRTLRANAAKLRRLGERDRAQGDELIRMAEGADATADVLGCPPRRQNARA